MFDSKCDASKYKVASVESLEAILRGRDLWIFGAGQKGRGLRKALNRNSIDCKGFIDSNSDFIGKKIDGLPVLGAAEFLRSSGPHTVFVLLASVDVYVVQMSQLLEEYGFLRNFDYQTIQSLSPFYPVVEVTGVCNLRCPSCIRSTPELITNGKFMSFKTYSQVINKLVSEIPFLYLIDLYIWGEPILNKELPEMIRLNNKLGLATGISTNLNDVRNLEKVLASHPDQVRVSVSGMSKDTYEVTHAGGKWEKVEKNLQYLSDLIQQYNSYTTVEFYFHIYKHNLHEIEIAKQLCRDLGFKFHPALGIILSSDIVSMYRQTGKLSKDAETIKDNLLVSIDELLRYCDETKDRNCILTRVVPVINWDLSVMPCCNYSYSNTISNNFLELNLNELIHLRTYSDLCRKCQAESLHRWNDQVNYASTVSNL